MKIFCLFLLAEQSYTGTEAYSPLVIILEVSPQVTSHHGKNSAKRQGDVSQNYSRYVYVLAYKMCAFLHS